MTRLIAQLTERQIIDALLASGFDAGEVRVVNGKLRSRREKMLRDLELTSRARVSHCRPCRFAKNRRIKRHA